MLTRSQARPRRDPIHFHYGVFERHASAYAGPSSIWAPARILCGGFVEQFPHLPQLVLNSLHQQDKLQALNDTLQTVIGQQRQQEKRRRRNTKRLVTATVVIVLLAAFLYVTQ